MFHVKHAINNMLNYIITVFHIYDLMKSIQQYVIISILLLYLTKYRHIMTNK